MTTLMAFFLKRPVFVSMIFIVLMVVGIVGYSRMGVNLLPAAEIPVVTVSVVYPGAGPEEVESSITKKIEDAAATVSDLDYMESYSYESLSVVVCKFLVGTDLDVALQDVREKVLAARGELPDEAKEPVVSKFDINQMPIMTYAVGSDKRPIREVRDLVDNVLKDRLLQTSGVAAVNVSGGQRREIRVAVKPERLAAYGLSINQLVGQLKAENLNIPSGRIDQANKEFTVRVMGEFTAPRQIAEMALLTPRGGVVRLRDVAVVKDTIEEVRSFARLDGAPAVQISIVKASDANTVETAHNVKRKVAELEQGILPSDVKLTLSDDSSTFAEDSVHDVVVTLILGAIIAILVVWLFLGSMRSTLIVSAVLPVTIVSTFAFMYAGNFTLNVMSMLGLSIAVGFLIDDAIVMVENIFRHAAELKQIKRGALEGALEITSAVIAISITTLAVFVPIGFMSGIVGEFFKEFGLTVAAAIVISTVASLSLTPMMAAHLLKPQDLEGKRTRLGRAFDRGLDQAKEAYGRFIEVALRRPWVTIGIIAVIFVVSLYPLKFLGGEFEPTHDEGKFTVLLELPAGTQLALTNKEALRLEKRLMALPDVRHVITTVGSGGSSVVGSSTRGPQWANCKVILKDKHRPTWQYVRQVRQWAADFPGAHIYAALSGTGNSGSREDMPLQIQIHGQDLEQLARYGQQIMEGIRKVPGVTDVDMSMKPGKPELRVFIDRAKCAHFGLTVPEVGAALRTALAGTDAGKYRESGNEYDLRVRVLESQRKTEEQLRNLKLPSHNGSMVPLLSVARLVKATGPTEIRHRDKGRIVVVRANLVHGYHSFNVQQAIQRQVISKIPFSAGYGVRFEGEARYMRDASSNLLLALVLGVIFIYAALAAQFESLRVPFVIMFSLPFVLSGVVWSLLLAGKTLNIVSAIGVIMLMGLVTKNAILMLDYASLRRRQGAEIDTALVEAGKVRFRPIMMTAAALVFALIPTALSLGRGSELRSPMAISVIGGYTTSLLLTLVVIPVIYKLITRHSDISENTLED